MEREEPRQRLVQIRDLHAAMLSWRQLQAAAACDLGYSDSEITDAMCIEVSTAAHHVAEAKHAVFGAASIEPSRGALGKWCREHAECCTALAAKMVENDQLFG